MTTDEVPGVAVPYEVSDSDFPGVDSFNSYKEMDGMEYWMRQHVEYFWTYRMVMGV